MDHLSSVEGLASNRFFKIYLYQQGLTTEADLVELKNNVKVAKTFEVDHLLDKLIEQNKFGVFDNHKFCSQDIYQGLFYLIDQGLLKKADGTLLVQGTWFESDARSLQEIS